MKQTFTTIMPDQIGAFLKADECISRLGLNITRVSYNKAVDVHMLFLEVEGSEEQLRMADQELTAMGYLNSHISFGNVILMEFRLQDKPGALLPVLQLIHQYSFNISYISSQENGTEYQYFKMGLFVEDDRKVSDFMHRAALLCPIRIIDYNRSEKILDNTVFYLSFAHDISEKMRLNPQEKGQLMIQSNRIMQTLDERNSPAYKTFDYIGKFADLLRQYGGENYQPRLTWHTLPGEIPMLLVEPPCGSNTCVFLLADRLLFIDSGFACYQKELWQVLRREIPGFDEKTKEMMLTHGDVDHAGCVDQFDQVYVNRICYDHFHHERVGSAALREENPLHAPYVQISKILSRYHPPVRDHLCIIGGDSQPGNALIERIGSLSLPGLDFEIYEGQGGHVAGEMIFLERKMHLVFTGDIFVNIKGFTREQAAFNSLAPYLMTSVDTQPAMAKEERESLWQLLSPGEWKVIGGHGGVYEKVISSSEEE